MNLKPFLIGLIPFVFLFAPGVYASLSSVDVSAQYGVLPVDSDMAFAGSFPFSAETHALVGSKPDDYAQSDAAIAIDAANPHPRCQISSLTDGYVTGSSGVSIYAHSQAVSSADWLIDSDTLPIGTPVRVWLEVGFDGQFYSVNGNCTSSAEASILLDGDEIYSGSALFANPDRTANGFWTDDLYENGDKAYDLYDLSTLIFDTAIGEIINLNFSVQTEIDCTNIIDAGASVDLTGNGYYSFSLASDFNFPPKVLDVDFVLIPEPASLLLLAAGLLRLRSKI